MYDIFVSPQQHLQWMWQILSKRNQKHNVAVSAVVLEHSKSLVMMHDTTFGEAEEYKIRGIVDTEKLGLPGT